MSNGFFAAYGAGLNRTEMAKRCPTAKPIGSAELKNYRLAFRGGHACATATIEKEKGASVPALLWEIIPKTSQRSIGCLAYRDRIAKKRSKYV